MILSSLIITKVSVSMITQIIGAIFIVFGCIVGLYKSISFLYGLFMKAHKAKQKEENFKNTITQHETKINEIKESQNAVCIGVRALLKNKLKELHKEYIERKSIKSDELDNFNSLYDAYAGLNGNGTGSRWHEEVNNLKVID